MKNQEEKMMKNKNQIMKYLTSFKKVICICFFFTYSSYAQDTLDNVNIVLLQKRYSENNMDETYGFTFSDFLVIDMCFENNKEIKFKEFSLLIDTLDITKCNNDVVKAVKYAYNEDLNNLDSIKRTTQLNRDSLIISSIYEIVLLKKHYYSNSHFSLKKINDSISKIDFGSTLFTVLDKPKFLLYQILFYSCENKVPIKSVFEAIDNLKVTTLDKERLKQMTNYFYGNKIVGNENLICLFYSISVR